MSMMSTPWSTAVRLSHFYQKKNVSFNSLVRNMPIQLMSNLFSSTTLLTMQEVCYMVVIDNCKLTGLESNKSGEVFDMLFHNKDTDYNTTSNISSDPFLICHCKHDRPDCDSSIVPLHYPSVVYPGETFQISVVAAGQREGTVSTTVRSTACTSDIDFHTINLNQYLQQTNSICTKLNYTLFSLSQEVNIKLYPEDSPCSNFYGRILNISVNLNQTCPP